MAGNGTKHWINGRVTSSRYSGRILDTYVNEAGHVFQPGSGYDYAEPTFPDEPNSTDCPVLYWNTRQSGVYQKTGCPAGYTGSNVEYVVPAHTYGSNISQADADNQAIADVTANGQAYANSHGYCIQNSSIAVLTVDFTNDGTIDAIMFCNTPGMNRYQQYISRDGHNFLDPADAPANAYGLASDRIYQPTLFLRFELNLARIVNDNPGVNTFYMDITGRKTTAGLVNGSYVLKDPTQGNMIMGGSPGSYIPSVSNPSSVGIMTFSTNVAGSGDGTLGIGIGSTILRFTITVDPGTGQISVAATTY